MKYFYLLSLAILVSSCGIFKRTYYHEYVVTVIDDYKGIPIDSAEVKLVILKDNVNLIDEVYYTDSSGKCEFKIASPIPSHNHLVISKPGYCKHLSLNNEERIPWYISIHEKTPKELTYKLTSDSLNHYKYFKVNRPRDEIDEFLEMLRINQFPQQRTLPQLKWDDIPSLLNTGMDTTIINRYPVNPISSLSSTECYMGIVTLWFVECIRLTEQQGEYATRVLYPSQTPFLLYTNSDLYNYPGNSKELMELAYTEYYSWWQKAKHMDRTEACKIDPLKDSKVKWK